MAPFLTVEKDFHQGAIASTLLLIITFVTCPFASEALALYLWLMSISAEQFKEFFRHHAAGVSLVTVFDENRQPFGFTASSLASLSADPPFATVNLASNTSTSKVIKVGSRVSVHTLSFENLDLAHELAGPRENRFQSLGWDLTSHSPENNKASAILRGEVSEIHQVAGSLIIVIAANEAKTFEFPSKPLVYFNREFI